ncbi:hypothetical protein [Kocuria nitroreducens]
MRLTQEYPGRPSPWPPPRATTVLRSRVPWTLLTAAAAMAVP